MWTCLTNIFWKTHLLHFATSKTFRNNDCFEVCHWYLTGHIERNLFLVTSNGLETPQGHFKTPNKPSGKIRGLLSINFWIFSKVFIFHDFHAIFMLFWINSQNMWPVKFITTSLIIFVLFWICQNLILRCFEFKTLPPPVKTAHPPMETAPPPIKTSHPYHENQMYEILVIFMTSTQNFQWQMFDIENPVSAHESRAPTLKTVLPPDTTAPPPIKISHPYHEDQMYEILVIFMTSAQNFQWQMFDIGNLVSAHGDRASTLKTVLPPDTIASPPNSTI